MKPITLPLFGWVPAGKRDTSQEAFDSVQDNVGGWRTKILREIKRTRSGLTCDDIEVLLGLAHQNASARICELSRMGFIRDIGDRRVTRSGRKAIVWTVSP